MNRQLLYRRLVELVTAGEVTAGKVTAGESTAGRRIGTLLVVLCEPIDDTADIVTAFSSIVYGPVVVVDYNGTIEEWSAYGCPAYDCVVVLASSYDHYMVKRLLSFVNPGGSLYIMLPHCSENSVHDLYSQAAAERVWVSLAHGGIVDVGGERFIAARLGGSGPLRLQRISADTGKVPVAFYLTNRHDVFSGSMLETSPMGGTETTLVLLAEALADTFDVHIFYATNSNDQVSTVTCNGVRYSPAVLFDDYKHMFDSVVVTGSTALEKAAALVPCTSKLIMWVRCMPRYVLDTQMMADAIRRCSCFIFGSRWSANTYISRVKSIYGLDISCITDRVVVTQGFVRNNAAYTSRRYRKPHLVYASMPNRGLEAYRVILPMLEAICPGLELHIYSSNSLYGLPDEPGVSKLLGDLSRHANCVIHEPVPYSRIIDIMGSSMVVGYPCGNEETMCNVVTMAVSCGTPVVTSRHSGLSETTFGSFYAIDVNYSDPDKLMGVIMSRSYIDAFVANVAELYNDSFSWESESGRLLKYKPHVDIGTGSAVFRNIFMEG